jgi:hypothetical protein
MNRRWTRMEAEGRYGNGCGMIGGIRMLRGVEGTDRGWTRMDADGRYGNGGGSMEGGERGWMKSGGNGNGGGMKFRTRFQRRQPRAAARYSQEVGRDPASAPRRTTVSRDLAGRNFPPKPDPGLKARASFPGPFGSKMRAPNVETQFPLHQSSLTNCPASMKFPTDSRHAAHSR